MAEDNDFSFPIVSKTPKVPLTTGSTVTDAATGVTTPIQTNLEDADPPGRKKVPLAPGYSQIGWMMKSQRNKRFGVGDYKFNKATTKEEVAQHSTVDDGWIIIKRKVYNMTPYINYHPGGVDILKPVLGRDATLLFDKYHPWVNVEALMEACWLGVLKQ